MRLRVGVPLDCGVLRPIVFTAATAATRYQQQQTPATFHSQYGHALLFPFSLTVSYMFIGGFHPTHRSCKLVNGTTRWC